jgi:hypothetical protein
MEQLVRRYEHPPAGAATGDLTPCELGLMSQNGEDGIIAEIVRRIGDGSRFFIEFGVHADQGNCLVLADIMRWSGLLIDGNHGVVDALEQKYGSNPHVAVRHAHINTANIDRILSEAGVPEEPDILSIDIDGNDFWVWAAVASVRPRVVIIEYNGLLDPMTRLVQPYLPDVAYDRTEFFGASLGALEALGQARGYQLVHTELNGVNAFFVRDDVLDCFADLDLAAVPRRALIRHRKAVDELGRRYLDIEKDEIDLSGKLPPSPRSH